MHAHIQDVCRRLARAGYLAIAPSLFERQGDVSALASIEAILPVVAQVPDAQVLKDLDATLVWAGRQGAVTPNGSASRASAGAVGSPGSTRPTTLGLYGGQDVGIPLESVRRMQQALKDAGSRSEIVVFPEAPHGFHADYRPTFRAREAAEGWQRLLAWFRANGVA